MLDKPSYPSEDNAAAIAASFRASVTHQLRLGSERMTRLEEATDHNTEVTKENTHEIHAMRADTAELIEIFKAVKGGLKVLGWVGIIAKWGVAISAGVGMVLKFTGYQPPWK